VICAKANIKYKKNYRLINYILITVKPVTIVTKVTVNALPVERTDMLQLTLATSSSCGGACLALIAVEARGPACRLAGVRAPGESSRLVDRQQVKHKKRLPPPPPVNASAQKASE